MTGVERGSAAYNHLLWFMSQSSLFSMFSSVFLSLDVSHLQSVLSELSESPKLYQTARLTVSHMAAGKVPDTARRGALTLPVSQIQVMCLVLLVKDWFLFFSLWTQQQTSDQSFSIFAGTSPS